MPLAFRDTFHKRKRHARHRTSRVLFPLPGGERDGVRGTGASLYGADLNPLTRRAPRGDLSPSGRGEEARLPLGFATGKQGQPLTSGQPPSFSGRKASAAGMVARTL
jgi:hypothetical protein